MDDHSDMDTSEPDSNPSVSLCNESSNFASSVKVDNLAVGDRASASADDSDDKTLVDGCSGSLDKVVWPTLMEAQKSKEKPRGSVMMLEEDDMVFMDLLPLKVSPEKKVSEEGHSSPKKKAKRVSTRRNENPFLVSECVPMSDVDVAALKKSNSKVVTPKFEDLNPRDRPPSQVTPKLNQSAHANMDTPRPKPANASPSSVTPNPQTSHLNPSAPVFTPKQSFASMARSVERGTVTKGRFGFQVRLANISSSSTSPSSPPSIQPSTQPSTPAQEDSSTLRKTSVLIEMIAEYNQKTYNKRRKTCCKEGGIQCACVGLIHDYFANRPVPPARTSSSSIGIVSKDESKDSGFYASFDSNKLSVTPTRENKSPSRDVVAANSNVAEKIKFFENIEAPLSASTPNSKESSKEASNSPIEPGEISLSELEFIRFGPSSPSTSNHQSPNRFGGQSGSALARCNTSSPGSRKRSDEYCCIC